MAAFMRHTANTNSIFRSKPFVTFATLAILLFFLFFISLTPSPPASVASISEHSRDFFKQHLGTERFGSLLHQEEKVHNFQDGEGIIVELPPREHNSPPQAVSIPGVKGKNAFITFLSGNDHEVAYEDDHYFIAARLLTWQLLHSKDTKNTDSSIPFIILVTPRVTQQQRERLRKDGAIIIQVPSLSADWIKADWEGWDHVLSKLRIWEFTDFERLAFLDIDTMLTMPIDEIFDDPAVKEQRTLPAAGKRYPGIDLEPPSSYVFAGNPENLHGHHFPPTEEGRDMPNVRYLNAGFFVIKPDIEMLDYYVGILNTPNSFNCSYPEQNLMNEIHDPRRNMPWQRVNYYFNIHYPTLSDVKQGVKSIHEKWWWGDDEKLKPWLRARRWEMEGYWQAMDAVRYKGKAYEG